VIPVVCVKIGKVMKSNTTMSMKVYLMAILDNYMFRPLLAIFRLSSRELKASGTISFAMSFRLSAWDNSDPTGFFFKMKFHI